jgi:hypothetical protein
MTTAFSATAQRLDRPFRTERELALAFLSVGTASGA